MEVMEVESSKSGNQEQRLVHLDLKGAPPKIRYYEKLFPMLSQWGATGLLVEYEDMFPYSGELQDIACPNAYSPAEIQAIQKLAEANSLIIIPLVQTYGHFEFVLKHKKFAGLREIAEYPMSLCPQASESLALVTSMIDQVVELHPHLKWFHIGADEVFHIGVCETCKKHMVESNMNVAEMFFDHVRRVVEYVKEKYPSMTCIMWDDMCREIDVNTLKASGLSDSVQIMVWLYGKDLIFPAGMWDRYAEAFPAVWVASAFKGATGPCMYMTDIGFHVVNHQQWLLLVEMEIRPKFKKFEGFCLTGWQRYDHYSVLCELLPTGIPSLALCLLTITNGAFTEDVHKQATNDLNFSELIPFCPFTNAHSIPSCDFPGSGVHLGTRILLAMENEFLAITESDRVKGWMTKYHIKHKFTNPAHINRFLPEALQLFDNYQKLKLDLRGAMAEIFYTDAIDEFVACTIDEKMEKLETVIDNAQKQLLIGAGPKVHP